MLVKTSELKDDALDWAVAKCKGITPIAVKKKYSKGYILYSFPASTVPLEYSSKWAQGGLIIEREHLCVMPPIVRRIGREGHACTVQDWRAMKQADENDPIIHGKGPTPLIAAMRCYVASKFGDTVEIPDQLL